MSAIDVFMIVSTMLGGLALFMFGMSTMSDALSALAGGILNKFLGWVTKNRFFAFLFGAGITAIVQSASAVSVLTVGLVNSKIIELTQAIGLLIGAGLGTTATAWMLSLNALDGQSFLLMIIKPSNFSPILAIVSVAITMFSKSESKRRIGRVLLGFSVMMMGMTMMSNGVAPLKELPALRNTLMSFTNPLLGFAFAVLFTMLIQSSDATVGILQAFALSVDVSYGMAIPLICGAQVGSCITAIMSSLGTGNNGKRTAFMNLYYSLLKTVPFLIIFYLTNSVFHYGFLDMQVGGIGIPLFHTGVNLLGAAVWLPCSGVIVRLSELTIPYSEKEKQAKENVLTMLDKLFLPNPEFALEQVEQAVCILANTVGEALKTVRAADKDVFDRAELLHERIRQYGEQIEKYIGEITSQTLDEKGTAYGMLLTNANIAFCGMGLMSEKNLEYVRKIRERDNGHREGIKEVNVLADTLIEIVELTVIDFETKSPAISDTIKLYREEFMEMSEIVKKRLIRLLHERDGMNEFTEKMTDFYFTQDRLLDYCEIVAGALLRYDQAVSPGVYTPLADAELDKKRAQIKVLFSDKYNVLTGGE